MVWGINGPWVLQSGESHVMEKGEKERGAYRTHKDNISPKPLAGKTRGADFHEFLQQAGLKD